MTITISNKQAKKLLKLLNVHSVADPDLASIYELLKMKMEK